MKMAYFYYPTDNLQKHCFYAINACNEIAMTFDVILECRFEAGLREYISKE
jgi:hypothetical protein